MPKPKFTDEFFLLPVRVFHYDLEDFEETGDDVIGWARVHYTSFQLATWHEGYPVGITPIEAKAVDSLPLTIIRCPEVTYYCTWGIKEFERKLNAFMQKIDELFPPEEEAPGQTEEDLEL